MQPSTTGFSDVIHLPAASATTDDVRHANRDVCSVQEGLQRLVETGTNDAHGVR